MKKYFVIALFVILIPILLYFFRKKTDTKIDSAEIEEHQILLQKFNMLQGNILIQYESEKSNVNDLICKDIKGNVFNLASLVNTPKLIYRYTEDHCSSCIEMALSSLLKHVDLIGKDNIIILTSYRNIRSLQAFFNSKDIDIRILNTSTILDIPLEKYNIPYFFHLDKEMKASMVLIPIKEISLYTDKYLKILANKMGNNGG